MKKEPVVTSVVAPKKRTRKIKPKIDPRLQAALDKRTRRGIKCRKAWTGAK